MKYNELKLDKQTQGSRVGRGISAGRGKTAGRGTKGQGARKSGGVRPGFEGGQMPLYMRIPKLRGFKSKRPIIETVYTGQLDAIKKSTVDNQALSEAGIVSSPHVSVKLIVNGGLTTKKDVRLQMASLKAVELLESLGGSFKKIPQVGRTTSKTEKSN